MGESDEENAGGDTIARILRKAYDDNSVKAVVLRVNSPGGSAFASEIIRQETENLQKIGKACHSIYGSNGSIRRLLDFIHCRLYYCR